MVSIFLFPLLAAIVVYALFALIEMQDPEQMKTFGEREDIAKARAEAGADVASTTVISPIGEHYMPS